MSDVEELLRNMAAQADQVDPQPPSQIRRTGMKRRRRRRGTLGALLVLACLAASGGVVSLVNRATLQPVTPSTPAKRTASMTGNQALRLRLRILGAAVAAGREPRAGDVRLVVIGLAFPLIHRSIGWEPCVRAAGRAGRTQCVSAG